MKNIFIAYTLLFNNIPADIESSAYFTRYSIPEICLAITVILLLSIIVWMFFHLKKTAKFLREARKLLLSKDMKNQTIIESLPVGVEVYSPEGILTAINSRDCEIFGVTKESVLDGSISIEENPNLPPKVIEAFRRRESVYVDVQYDFTAVQEAGFYETSLTTKTKRIGCKGAPILNSEGRMQNYIFIVDDITKQYNQERRLEESIRLFNQSIQVSDMVLWRYDNRTRLFSSHNDPVNNYDSDSLLSADNYLESIHPDDKKAIIEIVELMNQGIDQSFEFDIRIRTVYDDKWQNCIVNAAPFTKDEHGKVLEYTGFKRNNTKWKKLNDDLKTVNIQKELILNNINSGLVYITTDHVVQWENVSLCSAGLSFSAYKKGEICYESTYDRTFPCEDCIMRQAMESKLTERKKIQLNGRTLELTAIPLLVDKNEVEGVVIRIDDITEYQQMISELRETKERAVQSDKLKSTFLANMSHEICTPLNAIVGFSELLMSTDNQEEKEEYNRIISSNNELLLRVINDILDLAKIEAGVIERTPETFDLSAYFKQLYASLRKHITGQDIDFICDNPYPYCKVCLDKNRLTQIISKYFTNSVKFTRKGFIRMGYEIRDKGIRFYVSDSGIGIADDKKPLIFQRFEKLNEFSQGTGLGLAICKAITEANGGHAGFESVEGSGSTFWSWIPCEPNLLEEKKTGICSLKNGNDNPKVNPNAEKSRKKKILIVEDIESNYQLLYAILHKEYDLTWAVNGAIAVEKASSEHFDLIFMDMKMPVMNGMEATGKIREVDPAIPIIALTAHAFDADKEAALIGGCNDYVIKPVSKKLLMETLEKWI